MVTEGEPEGTRIVAKYENKSESFYLHNKEFIKQYFGVYTSRLETVASRIAEAALEKWGQDVAVKKLADLREDEVEKCVVVGTLYKQQKLKPSILRELSDENHVAPQPSATFYDGSDRMILEDGLNRIALIGKIDPSVMITGIVCAVLGYENDKSEFVVEDLVYFSAAPQPPIPLLSGSPLLVIISGLDQASSNDFALSMDLFQQWVFGNLPNSGQIMEAGSICRIVVAGNSVQTKAPIKTKNIQTQIPDSTDVLSSLKKVDTFLSTLCSSVNVDLMPGEFDPANHLMPQQPMHYCMFPEVNQKKSFKGVTNPYRFAIEERLILGTSGQNVQDISKYADLTPLEALRSSITWGHVAPSCPDTLPSYPFTDNDPFVIDTYPHIYFAGNCPTFETELFKLNDSVQTRLVCVPPFCETQSVAVINLATLDCHQLSFKVGSLDDIIVNN